MPSFWCSRVAWRVDTVLEQKMCSTNATVLFGYIIQSFVRFVQTKQMATAKLVVPTLTHSVYLCRLEKIRDEASRTTQVELMRGGDKASCRLVVFFRLVVALGWVDSACPKERERKRNVTCGALFFWISVRQDFRRLDIQI